MHTTETGVRLETLAYRVDDACRVFGLGRTRIYALIAEGKLDARACGGRTLITAASLREFLASLPRAAVRLRQQPAAPTA
jgi:excisionase family DNA binding protein